MLWQKTGVTNSLYIILIVVGVLAFVIADAFCDLYATGIDTILLCFIEDKHYNDGSSDKAYHCSHHLQKFMHHTADEESDGLKDPENGGTMDQHEVVPRAVRVKALKKQRKVTSTTGSGTKVGPAPDSAPQETAAQVEVAPADTQASPDYVKSPAYELKAEDI